MRIFPQTQCIAVTQEWLWPFDKGKTWEEWMEDRRGKEPPPLPAIGAHIVLDVDRDTSIGLPLRPVEATVRQHFECHDAYEPGIIAEVALDVLTGDERAQVLEKGLFLPRSAAITDIWPPLEMYTLEGPGDPLTESAIPTQYIVYEKVALSPATRDRMQRALDDVNAPDDALRFRFLPLLDGERQEEWSPLDFAWHFAHKLPGHGLTKKQLRSISSDVFFIADERTTDAFDISASLTEKEGGDPATSSLIVVPQKRQEPHRMDPIRIGRVTPRAAAWFCFSLPHSIPMEVIEWSEDFTHVERLGALPG